jgi:toxin YhaV
LSAEQPLVMNAWRIFAHPLFLDRPQELIEEVEALRQKHPESYQQKRSAKCLAALAQPPVKGIAKLTFDVIPQNPTRSEYRQGSTLGEDYKHWFRAKFFQQYRLFFRYHQEQKIIVFVWVNDEKSKRAYGSKTDAYFVFQKMLDGGDPPNSWDALLRCVMDEDGADRLEQMTQQFFISSDELE